LRTLGRRPRWRDDSRVAPIAGPAIVGGGVPPHPHLVLATLRAVVTGGTGSRESSATGIGSTPWPLVGRHSEVEVLADALVRGRGGILIGEAGVGKTRLARAVLEHLAGAGWATASFEAGPAGSAVPFLPFASLVRGPAHETLERLVDATATLVGRGERVAALVDDVHALDDVSLAFVTHLLAATDVRLVLTVRAGDEATRLVRAWSDTLPRVDVAPLDRDAVDALVTAALGDTDPVALRWVWDTTAGNPLFVRELVSDAVERGALFDRGGRWALGRDARPPGRRLRDVVVDRFGSLWDAERDAVELLSVAAPIGLRMFEKLVSPDVVLGLEHRGLIASERSGRRVTVRLAHPMHGEVVRETLGPSTIASHQRRLLDAVNTGGERRRSDRLRTALWRVDLGEPVDPRELVIAAEDMMVLVNNAGVGMVTAGRPTGGPQVLERAAQLARAALDGGGGLDAAILLLGILSRLGRDDEARAVRDSLDDLTADEADRMLVARADADVEAIIFGDPHAALRRIEELEGLVSSPANLRSLRTTRANALSTAGQIRRSLEEAQLVLADPDATAVERVRATGSAADGLAVSGRSNDALDLLDAAQSLLSSSEIRMQMTLVMPRIVALAAAGRLRELDALLDMCWSLCDAAGIEDGMAVFGGALANAALLEGRAQAARRWSERSLELIDTRDPFGVVRLAHAVRAHASALLGDGSTAAASVARLDALGRPAAFEHIETRARAWTEVVAGRTEHAVQLLLEGAELAAARGHVVGAIDHLHDVARIGHPELVVDRTAELAAGAQGAMVPLQAAHIVALAARDADELEEIARGFADLGADLVAAEAFAQAASIHRRAGRQGRSSDAAGRSRELIERCEGVTTPALGGAEPLLALTRREREIVLLAADGLSNRDIADRLVLSVRTVHTHLYRAYGKLGVERREELSAAIAPY
jgi:DNA-binding CsgD family transcriptional regulator